MAGTGTWAWAEPCPEAWPEAEARPAAVAATGSGTGPRAGAAAGSAAGDPVGAAVGWVQPRSDSGRSQQMTAAPAARAQRIAASSGEKSANG